MFILLWRGINIVPPLVIVPGTTIGSGASPPGNSRTAYLKNIINVNNIIVKMIKQLDDHISNV